MKEKSKCIKFLKANGWEYDSISSGGAGYYIKKDLIAIDMSDDHEIVLLDDTGDFLQLPMNFYALLGALVDLRQIAVNYNK